MFYTEHLVFAGQAEKTKEEMKLWRKKSKLEL
jgi:hypothetical protein